MSDEKLQDTELLRLIELALSTPESDRHQALLDACDNPDQVRSVLLLIEDDSTDAGFLQPVTGIMAGLRLGDLLRDSEEEPEIEALGPYRLTRKLGEGGMGVVFLAHQTEPVERQVAIKLMRRTLLAAGERGRFTREQQALARLTHPNIGQIYEMGTTEDGFPYFVMEYIDGPSITDYCDRKKLDLNSRLALFIELCQAIHHAHQKRLLHLDLKPSNILVTDVEAGPVVKVIDFGISVQLDERFDVSGAPEGADTIGTPNYASPELMDPELGMQDLDTRADVYGLGVVLYLLLCGRLPVNLSLSTREAMHQQLMKAIIKPPSQQFNSLNAQEAAGVAKDRSTPQRTLSSQLAGDLDAICLKAISPERDSRYASALELVQDLGRHLEHHPVMARDWSLGYRLGRFWSRHRLAISAAATVVIVLLAAVVMISLALQRSIQSEANATQVAEYLEDLLQVTDPYSSRNRGSSERSRVSMNEKLVLGAQQALEELQDRPEVQATLLHTIGSILRSYPDPEAPVSPLEQAVSLRTDLYGPDHPDTLASQHVLGHTYERLGRYGEAESIYARHYQHWRTEDGPGDARTIEARVDLAKIRFTQHRDEASTRALGLALDQAEAARVSPVVVGDLLNTLGWDAHYRGEHDEAVAYLSRALALYEGFFHDIHSSVALMKGNLAVMSLPAGHVNEAELLILDALDIYRQTLDEDHWRIANTLGILGAVRMYQDRYDEAEPLLQDAVEKVALGTGENTVYTLYLLGYLEELYTRWDRPDDAAGVRAEIDRRS